MNLFDLRSMNATLVAIALSLSLLSCNNDKIEVYKIPKEGINVAMQSGSAGLVPPPGYSGAMDQTRGLERATSF